jgi:hypothetical protein
MGIAASIVVLLVCAPAESDAKTIYVRKPAYSGETEGAGTSWSDPYFYISKALAGASSYDDIRIAAGTYRPDEASGDRNDFYSLSYLTGVSILGGFPSSGGSPAERDPFIHKTVLSGDIGVKGDPSDNSYLIFYVGVVDETSYIDGFTFEDGVQGLEIYYSDLLIRRCVFKENVNDYGSGGGVAVWGDSAPTFQDCRFRHNEASDSGGAVFLASSDESPDLILFRECFFAGNSAGYTGGGIAQCSMFPVQIVNSVFTGNETTLTGISYGGGAISLDNTSADMEIINSSFANNITVERGGGIRCGNIGTLLTVWNCILYDNEDKFGNGEYSQIESSPTGDPEVEFSCIMNLSYGFGGAGNIASDPRFIDPYGVDKVPGTMDDNLRLRRGSPCIDASNNHHVPSWVLLDYADNDRFVDAPAVDTGLSSGAHSEIADMGAYEHQKAALRSKPFKKEKIITKP